VYAVAVLTETPKGVSPRPPTVARIARAAYDEIMLARTDAGQGTT
jgi:hypothetical protein